MQAQLDRTLRATSILSSLHYSFPRMKKLQALVFSLIQTMYRYYLADSFVDSSFLVGRVGLNEEFGFITAQIYPDSRSRRPCRMECFFMYHAQIQSVFLQPDDIRAAAATQSFSADYLLNERVLLLKFKIHFCNTSLNHEQITHYISEKLDNVLNLLFSEYFIYLPHEQPDVNTQWVINHTPYMTPYFSPQKFVSYNQPSTMTEFDRSILRSRIFNLFDQYVTLEQNELTTIPDMYTLLDFHRENGYSYRQRGFFRINEQDLHIQSYSVLPHSFGFSFTQYVDHEFPFIQMKIFTGVRPAVLRQHHPTLSSFGYLFRPWDASDQLEIDAECNQTVVVITMISKKGYDTNDYTFAVNSEVFYFAPRNVFMYHSLNSVPGLLRHIDWLSYYSIYRYIEEELLSDRGCNIGLLLKLEELLNDEDDMDDDDPMDPMSSDPFRVRNMDELYEFKHQSYYIH